MMKSTIKVKLIRTGVLLFLENLGIIKPKIMVFRHWVTDNTKDYLGFDNDWNDRNFEVTLINPDDEKTLKHFQ